MQQRFYLVEPTMKTLAKGINSDAIFKLIKVLINMQQDDYQVALQGDTREINDVCSQITTDRALYGATESKDGLKNGFDSPDEDVNALGGGTDEQRAHLSPTPFNDMDSKVTLNNVILGVNMNETVNQINTGKGLPESNKLQDMKQQTGWRSAQFDFLLDEVSNQPKPTRDNSPYLRK